MGMKVKVIEDTDKEQFESTVKEWLDNNRDANHSIQYSVALAQSPLNLEMLVTLYTALLIWN